MTATVEPPDTAARPLTVEERDLAAENVRLVGWALTLPLVQGAVRQLGLEEAQSIGSLAFVEALPRWRPEKGELSTFMVWSIVGPVLTAARRAGRNRPESLGNVRAETLIAPEKNPDAGLDVDSIIGHLSEDDKRLLVEHFVEEKTHVMLAQERGYTPEGLGARIARLRRHVDKTMRHRLR